MVNFSYKRCITITPDALKRYIEHLIAHGQDKSEIERLKSLLNCVFKDNKLFRDIEPGLSEQEYNHALKDVKKTYFSTFPTSMILMGKRDPFKGTGHLPEELNTPIFGGLSIKEIYTILNSLELEDIMILIGINITTRTHVRIGTLHKLEIKGNRYNEETGKEEEVVGIYKYYTKKCPGVEDEKIIPHRTYRRPRTLYSIPDRTPDRAVEQTMSINGKNAYEVLYRYLRKPIGTVLASINAANTNFFTLLESDEELCQKIREAQAQSSFQIIEPKRKVYLGDIPKSGLPKRKVLTLTKKRETKSLYKALHYGRED